jgi:hypothetical protein
MTKIIVHNHLARRTRDAAFQNGDRVRVLNPNNEKQHSGKVIEVRGDQYLVEFSNGSEAEFRGSELSRG